MRPGGRGPGERAAHGQVRRLHGPTAIAKLRSVGVDFVSSATTRWAFEATVAAPQRAVFGALAADPKTYAAWFPGFRDGGYEGAPGPGAKRWVRVGPTRYDETILAWDEPTRWTYRVDETTVPMAYALVEDWTVEPRGDGSLVRWTFAMEPRLFFKVAGPVGPIVMRALFRRAMRNLDRHLATP